MGGWAGRDGLHLSVVAPHGMRKGWSEGPGKCPPYWKCLEVAVCIDEGKNGF